MTIVTSFGTLVGEVVVEGIDYEVHQWMAGELTVYRILSGFRGWTQRQVGSPKRIEGFENLSDQMFLTGVVIAALDEEANDD